MHRAAALLLLIASAAFAADPADLVREAANGWTQAAVKQDATGLRRYMADFSDRKRTKKGEGGGGSGEPKVKAASSKARGEKGAGAPPAEPAKSSGDGETPASWSFPVRPDRKEL